jgi:hypothetical protein
LGNENPLSFTPGPDQTTLESKSPAVQTITNWATNIAPGLANQARQNLHVPAPPPSLPPPPPLVVQPALALPPGFGRTLDTPSLLFAARSVVLTSDVQASLAATPQATTPAELFFWPTSSPGVPCEDDDVWPWIEDCEPAMAAREGAPEAAPAVVRAWVQETTAAIDALPLADPATWRGNEAEVAPIDLAFTARREESTQMAIVSQHEFQWPVEMLPRIPAGASSAEGVDDVFAAWTGAGSRPANPGDTVPPEVGPARAGDTSAAPSAAQGEAALPDALGEEGPSLPASANARTSWWKHLTGMIISAYGVVTLRQQREGNRWTGKDKRETERTPRRRD